MRAQALASAPERSLGQDECSAVGNECNTTRTSRPRWGGANKHTLPSFHGYWSMCPPYIRSSIARLILEYSSMTPLELNPLGKSCFIEETMA